MSAVALDEFSEQTEEPSAGRIRATVCPIKSKNHLQVSGQGQIRRNRLRIAGSTKNFKQHNTAGRIGGYGGATSVAQLIEVYVPSTFRKPVRWVPSDQRGKLIEFRPL